MIYSVIIVGGGFSGLVLANECKSGGVSFLLLEKNDRLGKKILATGNGRGNVSNVDLSKKHYHSNENGFCDYAIKNYDNRLIARFFEERGVLLSEENGKIYPVSRQANAVLDALRLGLSEDEFKTLSEVTDITYDKNKKIFSVVTACGTYYAQNVALGVGGKSSPNFGSDGKSYRLAEKFGHKITKLYPSLVQLTAKKEAVKGLKGVKENAKVTAFDGEVMLSETVGDILFTDNGVSGNTVFSLSSYLVDKKQPKIKIDFLPDLNVEACKQNLKNRRAYYKNLAVESFLSGLVHSRISYKTVFGLYGENTSKLKYSDVTDRDIDKLVTALKNTEIEIVGNLGFSQSQVTKGGVSVKDVDESTMESKLQKGLYLIGEILDVDGDCGGYNLQWAFSSAKCAYRSIKGEK